MRCFAYPLVALCAAASAIYAAIRTANSTIQRSNEFIAFRRKRCFVPSACCSFLY